MHNRLNPDSVHDWLGKYLHGANHRTVLAGSNDDDCGVFKLGNSLLVASTDFLHSNPIASQLGIGDEWDLGRLTVAANLSDLCGSGARPVALLIGTMFPRKTGLNSFKRFMKGARYEANRYKVPIIGGDTKLGRSIVFFGVALGTAPNLNHLFLKNRAQVGHGIWTSGELGATSCSIDILTGKYKAPNNLQAWARRSIVHPTLPLKKSLLASGLKAGLAGTDLSDGLAVNLRQICKASGVGACLESSKIPLPREVKRFSAYSAKHPWEYALLLGGDFQFIITAPERFGKTLGLYGFCRIGTITKRKGVTLRIDGGRSISLPSLGHSDVTSRSFSSEIRSLSSRLAKAQI